MTVTCKACGQVVPQDDLGRSLLHHLRKNADHYTKLAVRRGHENLRNAGEKWVAWRDWLTEILERIEKEQEHGNADG